MPKPVFYRSISLQKWGTKQTFHSLIITTILAVIFLFSTIVNAQDSADSQFQEPDMLYIPGGTFRMGCTFKPCIKYAQPIHTVSINSFLLSKYEITFNQWDQCVAGGGCRHTPSDNGWGRGDNPVINVSWDDAQGFVSWLNQVSGKSYTLPSEQEWEYAARAGTETKYSWGDHIGANRANCTGCLKAEVRQAFTVGSFPPNSYGLYDMHGNVYEMTQDCWRDSYTGSAADTCYLRTTRGGAWSSGPEALISSNRFNVTSFRRYNVIGFRVAQIIDPSGP